eukprot:CAMPEP_0177698212 /NCGR_PEP_ID=MMETSP0484_2-20121128/4919_1 /TAXON_ID=354590 /ORGANISM="Rhodomonas lens, Strain RHODO" /LENGTH=474 /DNA_ID=CAMNT_0019209287 /DNA_START=143 /DNA_END=1564 /DNA_ORIENTATION=-
MAAKTGGVQYNAPTEGVKRSNMTWMEDYLCSKMTEHLGEQLNIGCLCYLSKDVTRAELKARLMDTLMSFERLRSRIVQDKGGKFFFEDHGDAAQVIDSMIFERDLQKGEEEDFIQGLRDNVTLNAWPPEKPHWDVHIIRGIPKSTETKNCSVALFFRIDHTLGDGQSLLHALLSVCQAQSGDVLRFPQAPSQQNKSAVAKIGTAILSVVMGVLYQTIMFLPALCVALSSRVLSDTTSIVKLPMAIPGPTTTKNVGLTPAQDLAVLKRLGKAHKCTINDLMIAWVAGSVRRYLLQKQDPSVSAEKEVSYRARAVFAYSRRKMEPGKITDFANQIVFLPVPLPVAVPALSARIARVRDATAFIKKSLVAFFTHGLMMSLAAIPGVGRKALADEVMQGLIRITSSFSSLAGPIHKVQICGATVEYMAISANPAGVALSFTSFSYAGMVTMSATTHPRLVDGREMMKCVGEEWGAMAA